MIVAVKNLEAPGKILFRKILWIGILIVAPLYATLVVLGTLVELEQHLAELFRLMGSIVAAGTIVVLIVGSSWYLVKAFLWIRHQNQRAEAGAYRRVTRKTHVLIGINLLFACTCGNVVWNVFIAQSDLKQYLGPSSFPSHV